MTDTIQPATQEKGNVMLHATGAEKVSELERMRRLIKQARLAITKAGHGISCGFSGCTCGAVEDFKIESGEFWRQIREYDEFINS